MNTVLPTQRAIPVGPRSLARLIAPTDADMRRGRIRLSGKAIAIVALAVTSYTVLVFMPVVLPVRILAALVLVLAVVAIGTGVMHDANHGALGRSRRINHLVGYSSDLLEASSWIWRYKHNRLHHANTNVTGKDSDIDQAPFARLAPDQPWHPWHRYQHIYLWALYGLLTAKWFASPTSWPGSWWLRRQPLPRASRRRDVALVMLGKVLHVTWAIAIPLVFFPWWGCWRSTWRATG
jgi:linoleoyl-CoA desaturase